MKLGILVNTDRHVNDIVGLTEAAVSKGHEVNIFLMDTGVRLINNESVRRLCDDPHVEISYCDYIAKKFDIPTENCPEEVICGSQYDNAMMQHEADRVIVL